MPYYGMPPGQMPPMMPPFNPFAPPPRRGGVLKTLAILVLVLMLGGSLLMNVAQLGSGSLAGRSVQQSAVSEGNATETIAVIPITGVIYGPTADRFSRHLNVAERDPNVKAIVLEVETPGGSVTASDEIHHRIDSYKTAHPNVPIVVTMGGLATSGGYYVSARADYIFAQPTTMTGNIGVLMPNYNFSDLAKKLGIHESTVTAPKEGFKNAGSWLAPETEPNKEYLQNLIDGAYKRFKQVVKTGRGAKLTKPIEQIADGKVYLADQALADGLVDQIGFADDAYAYAAKQAGLSKPNVVKYREQPSLFDLLGGAESRSHEAASAQSGGVTINGVNVNLDAGLIEALRTPRVLYMWQGQ
jgi:protease-4